MGKETKNEYGKNEHSYIATPSISGTGAPRVLECQKSIGSPRHTGAFVKPSKFHVRWAALTSDPWDDCIFTPPKTNMEPENHMV